MRPPKENIVIYNYKSNYEPKRSSRTVGVESGDGAKDRRTGVAETQDGVDKEGNAEGAFAVNKYKVVDECGISMRVFHSRSDAKRFLQDGWSIMIIKSPNKYNQALEKVGEALL